MKRDAQSAIIAGAGRYIRKLIGQFEPRLKAVEEAAAAIPALVQRSVEAIPAPRDGKDGASVTAADVEPLLREMVGALPVPRDGTDGKSVTIDELRPLVEQAVASVPVPKDGRDGIDGQSVTVDQVMAALAPSIEAAIAKAALETERRGMDLIQRAIERIPVPKDGKDGRDGKDGLDLRHLSAEQDADGRTVMLTLKDDERTEHVHMAFPVVIDRGVFREDGKEGGGLYERGDGVTYGGSWWIAQKDAPGGKPGLSDDWRLAVKKGRDGRDGRDGIDKTLPVKV